MTTEARYLIITYNNGYRVINGNVYSHKNKLRKLKKQDDYYCFNIRVPKEEGRKTYPIRVHRLLAYQKFGDKMFEPNIVVRHWDNNSLNNLDDNIVLGTQHDNMMDRKPEDRLTHSLKASVKSRKFTDAEIELIRQDSKINKLTYPEIMKKWNISSKGTLSYIINNKYKTKV